MPSDAAAGAWQKSARRIVPGVVLVKFKQTPAAATLASAQAAQPLPGVQLQGAVGVPGLGSL